MFANGLGAGRSAREMERREEEGERETERGVSEAHPTVCSSCLLNMACGWRVLGTTVTCTVLVRALAKTLSELCL